MYNEIFRKNKETGTRYIEAYNTDEWDTVREVIKMEVSL